MTSLTWPEAVDIREVGPRDGLQIEAPISTAAKLRLLDALVATGVGRIEATAFVSPRAVPAMADAEAVMAYVTSLSGPEWSALVASPNGARAVAAGARLVEAVQTVAGGAPLGAHFHNTRGMGIASALAAVQAGVTRLDASVGGLGGCPFAPGASGNIATEELVYLLDDAGVETGLDLDAVLDAARLAAELVGHPLDSALLRAGGRSRRREA